MELTSSDTTLVTELQNREYAQIIREIRGWDIVVTKTLVSNGVTVEITASDSRVITEIQSYMSRVITDYSARNYGYYSSTPYETRENANAYQCSADITRSFSHITNGVALILTSSNIHTVQALQSYPRSYFPSYYGSPTSITITNISNGIQVNITSSDSRIVARIQGIALIFSTCTPRYYETYPDRYTSSYSTW